MNIALYAMAGIIAVSTLYNVGTVGKTRKPLEPAGAAVMVVMNAAFVVILVLAAGRLG